LNDSNISENSVA